MNRLLIVAILLIATAPLYAQAQPDVAKLKADAQKVVSIISGDKAKTQTFCQMEILGNQIDEAILKQDTKKSRRAGPEANRIGEESGPRIPRPGRVSTEHGPDFKRWSGNHVDVR
jgi:hypothetical protein